MLANAGAALKAAINAAKGISEGSSFMGDFLSIRDQQGHCPGL
jgi:hypothetical protein